MDLRSRFTLNLNAIFEVITDNTRHLLPQLLDLGSGYRGEGGREGGKGRRREEAR